MFYTKTRQILFMLRKCVRCLDNNAFLVAFQAQIRFRPGFLSEYEIDDFICMLTLQMGIADQGRHRTLTDSGTHDDANANAKRRVHIVGSRLSSAGLAHTTALHATMQYIN